jgi:DNA-binding transcriptional ArsR family regulator
VTRDDAYALAVTLQGLASASRVLIVDVLRAGPLSAGEVALGTGLARRACTEQLWALCALGAVVGTRRGRVTVYRLRDGHVAELVGHAVRHLHHRHPAVG